MSKTEQKAHSISDIVKNTWQYDGKKFYGVKDYDFMPQEFKDFIKKEDKFRVENDGMTFNVKHWEDSDKYSVSAWANEKKGGYGSGYGGPRNIIVKEFSVGYIEVVRADAFNELVLAHPAKNGQKWQYLGFTHLEDAPHLIMGLMDPVYYKLGTTGDSEEKDNKEDKK